MLSHDMIVQLGQLIWVRLVRPLSPGDLRPLPNRAMAIREFDSRSRKYRRMHFSFACQINGNRSTMPRLSESPLTSTLAGPNTQAMAAEHQQYFLSTPNVAIQSSVATWLQDSASHNAPQQEVQVKASNPADDCMSVATPAPAQSLAELLKASSPAQSSTTAFTMGNALSRSAHVPMIDLTQVRHIQSNTCASM